MNCNCPTCTKFVLNECIIKNVNIKDGKCTHIITNDISGQQHRFYRGLLLPALTEALGETNNQYAHEFILKSEWIYRKTGEYFYKVEKFDDIPVKHQSTGRIITEIIEMVTPEQTYFNKTEIIGYIPSMANFTKSETKDYFKFCETMLEEIGGQIPTSDNQEYSQLRTQVIR